MTNLVKKNIWNKALVVLHHLKKVWRFLDQIWKRNKVFNLKTFYFLNFPPCVIVHCMIHNVQIYIKGKWYKQNIVIGEVTKIEVEKNCCQSDFMDWWYQPMTLCWLTHYYGIWVFLGVSLLFGVWRGEEFTMRSVPNPLHWPLKEGGKQVIAMLIGSVGWKQKPSSPKPPTRERFNNYAIKGTLGFELNWDWDAYHVLSSP